MAADLFHANRPQIDGRTDRNGKLLIAFRVFANKPKIRKKKTLSLSYSASLLVVTIKVAILHVTHLVKGSRNLCGT